MTEPIVWTPGDWDDLKAGSNVRLEHPNGLSVIAGQVDSHLSLWRNSLASLRGLGFQLFVPVPPKPEPTLPTEPGTYWADHDGDAWLCSHSGMVALAADTTRLTDGDSKMFKADHYAPFVRLEPRSVTATAILKRVRELVTMPTDGCRPDGTFRIRHSDIAALETEFGATL